jgi:Tat protein secretion system quality control protein TatD with DNase activity
MKLFDAHCHLQDPRIITKAPQIISSAVASGVSAFAVNGVSEIGVWSKRWELNTLLLFLALGSIHGM